AELAHLTELLLGYVDIDLNQFGSSLFPAFPAVRALQLKWLRIFGSEPFCAAFCRIISAMFPACKTYASNLETAEFTSGPNFHCPPACKCDAQILLINSII